MCRIKDKNGKDLTEEIKKRWQEYIEELFFVGFFLSLNDADNHNGMVTHLEPGILDSEVKWVLGSITTKRLVEVMEFQLSYAKS